MQLVGTIEALWRYPVKSMGGEQLTQAFLAEGGLIGDRVYAFEYSAAPATFPYLTARQQPEMLLYRATYCSVAGNGNGRVFVNTPDGERLAIQDESIITRLSRSVRAGESLRLLTSNRAMADCHPVSLLSIQTTQQLAEELGVSLDKMRFRANLYVNLYSGKGFEENDFVGRRLMIGSTAVVDVIERDERCKIITLDPCTGAADPNIMRHIAHEHERKVGIYGAVSVEGKVEAGDEISLLP
jgi:uncharacterized protein YcbX